MDPMQLLQSSLNAATLRQEVYANNIANAQTPNYKRQDVQFETYYQQALQSAPQAQLGETHIPLATPGSAMNLATMPNYQPTVVTDTSSAVDNNGNNVDLTSEMSDLAENQVKYETLVQDVADRISRLRSAITGS